MNTPGETVPTSEEQAVRFVIERAAETLQHAFRNISHADRAFAIISVAPGRTGRLHAVGNGSRDELASLVALALEHLRHSPLAPPSLQGNDGADSDKRHG